MKFLYCADIHLKNKNPVNRLDNYYKSSLEKLEEINILAKAKDCDFVICNGDVFDSPNVSNTTIDDFVDLAEKYKCQWYIVPGNHDMNSHSWELSKASALAHIFRRCKYIQELNEKSDDVKLGDNGSSYIKGYKYYHTIEEDFKTQGLKNNTKKDFTIAIPHAFISEKPFFKEVSHICVKDLDTNYDLVLCGHIHTPFDKTINKTRFLNCGSIGRTSIVEQHHPSVAIVDTVSKEIDIIKLKSAHKASEIFDLLKYEESKNKEKNIKEFLDSLKDVNFQTMSISQQISKIGKEQNIEPEVIDYLLTKICKFFNIGETNE